METAGSAARVLGACWIVYGILRLAGVLWLLAMAQTATLMFGMLLQRVADPFTLMTMFHIFYAAGIVWSGVTAALGIAAGVNLLSGRRNAMGLTLVAAVVSLPGIPLGLLLGVYTLVSLLPRRALTAPAAA
jgi:hypothetical protein